MRRIQPTKKQSLQHFIRYYREQTGETEVDMHKVAEYAIQMGWNVPKPASPVDLLASDFSQAAREELRKDSMTGRPYRANHAFPIKQGQQLSYLWVDIDQAERKSMHKSLVTRREQIVGDAVQLTLDAEHWNNIHPVDQPIVMPLDFTDDVAWRLSGPEAKSA